MSFIKGSAEAMATAKGYLSEETYLVYPNKKCPLPCEHREIVYKLFQKYESLKFGYGDYDLCDYVFHIINQVCSFYVCSNCNTILVEIKHAQQCSSITKD
jgi:hypothetical protein